MKKIIVFALLSLTLYSCGKKCTSTSGLLTSDELSWIPYSGGEKLIFKNQNANIDTLYVGQRIVGTNSGTTEDHPCTHPHQEIDISTSDFLSTASFGIYIAHGDQWNYGGAKGIDANGVSSFQFTNYTPQNNISINGNIYNSVYVMNIDTSTYTVPTIWKIYYTKANGILKYEFTKNGGVWEKN
jgi:hypothetical protein